MNQENFNIRTFIQEILSENFNTIEEAKKGAHFDMYLELAFSKMSPEIPEGKFGNININNEIHSVLNTKLSNIFRKDFEYVNFYIVKLGRFVIKSNGIKDLLSFKKEGEEEKRYSYMYLYIYNNTVELIRFGSSFFETDDILIRAAKDYIVNKKINLITKTEQGQIIIEDNFAGDNVIDVTDYSQIQRPEPVDKKRFGAAYVPKTNYKVGDKIIHRDFGPGVVVASKKLKAPIPTYDVTAKFKQGEREVEKTIRMQQKTQGQKEQQVQ